jgi:hypothetical protein
VRSPFGHFTDNLLLEVKTPRLQDNGSFLRSSSR